MNDLKRMAVSCLLWIIGSSPLYAQETEEVHPYLTETFFVDLGIYYPDRETTLGVDGGISGINRDFDFERATGINDDDETFSMDFGWAFRVRYDWLDASVDKYKGILINRSIGPNYQFTDRFGIGVNYQAVKLDVSINKTSWRGRLEQRLEGAFVYLSAFW